MADGADGVFRGPELRQTFGYDAWCGVCGKVATHVGGACVECCDVPARPVAPARQDPDRRRSA